MRARNQRNKKRAFLGESKHERRTYDKERQKGRMAIVEKSFQSDLDQSYDNEEDDREETYGQESYGREVQSRHMKKGKRRDAGDS